VVRLFFSLVLIGAVCGLLLVGTYTLTAEPIKVNREARARAVMTEMLGTLMPAEADISLPTFGTCNNWLFQRISTNGYAGPIRWLALWRAEKGSLTLRVIQHRETPGIGDFIDHARNPWIFALDNQPLSAYHALDNVSGATITTKAVRNAAARAAAGAEEYCANPDI
jgi:H+/Na+-translocating ferredoxin:NAD+ oxidoreductase subunit G